MHIIFQGGADRGYGKFISAQFPYLRELKAENPEEYKQLIESNEQYQQLEEMFPSWTDPNNLQRQYERRDVGLFAAVSSGSRDGSAPECNIM